MRVVKPNIPGLKLTGAFHMVTSPWKVRLVTFCSSELTQPVLPNPRTVKVCPWEVTVSGILAKPKRGLVNLKMVA